MKMKLIACFLIACISAQVGYTQLNVGTGQLFIQTGAIVSVQGDVTSGTDILGPGKILLNGTANQNVNMGGFIIPNLEVNNTANVTMTGDAKIGTSLLFTAGKILAGAFNLTLADVATASGGGTSKFIETSSTGQVKKNVTANLASFEMPVGSGTLYSPVFLTTTGSNAGAVVGVKSVAVADPNKPIRSTDYLTRYWPITQTGIAGTLSATGQYNDPTDISAGGLEASLYGMFYNGTNWSLGPIVDALNNKATATIVGNGDLYAMNKFVLSKMKVYLEAPFNAGVMDDKLRTSVAYVPGTYPASNLIPLSDPYRTAPLNASFSHFGNTSVETITQSVLNDLAIPTDQIVDWVYVELRTNVMPGNTIVQTRSALLKRDGNIVDIDGVSPLYFKDIAAGTYALTVRHRNHLALSLNPTTASVALDLPAGSTVDFTTLPASSLMGIANSAYFNDGIYNMLYGGNANFNTKTSFNGLSNDKDYILLDPTYGLNGNSGTPLTNVYYPTDVNMNRKVSFNGLNNDKDFILLTVLGGNSGSPKTQVLPN